MDENQHIIKRVDTKRVEKDEFLYIQAVDTMMNTHASFQEDMVDQCKEERYIYANNVTINTYIRPLKRPKYDNALSNKKASIDKEAIIDYREKADGLPVTKNAREMIYSVINNKKHGMKWMNEKHGGLTNREMIKEVSEGDFSHFENLDTVFRDTFATNYILDFMKRKGIKQDARATGVNFDDYIEESKMFNPLFRLGLSQMARFQEKNGINDGLFRALDNEIARRIMANTLTRRLTDDNEVKNEYIREKIKKTGMTDETVEAQFQLACKKEKAKQAQMAKQLMLMHMGGVYLLKKDGTKGECNVPVATVVAHCSRTLIHTPFYSQHRGKYNSSDAFKIAEDKMWKSILNHYDRNTGEYENAAEIHKRGSSTHSFNRRKAGNVFGKERKVRMNLFRQTGMTVAIGGVGQSGVGGNMLDMDGSCGYVYGMRKKSMENRAGGYLFGYESDSYRTTNQLGHMHDLLATGEKASSFGCQRIDEIGEKYGGRQADISAYTPEQITLWMNVIDKAVDGCSAENLKRFMNILTGKKIYRQDISRLVDCLAEVITEVEKNELILSLTQNIEVDFRNEFE